MASKVLIALVGSLSFLLSAVSFASDAAASEGAMSAVSGGNLAAAIAISLAVIGGALGQGKVAAAALEGIARNPAAQPKLFVPMIIGLALIESLVLYAFVIAFVKIQI